MSASPTDYSAICELFDRCLGPVMFEPYAADLVCRLPKLANGSVLEMACGSGILTEQLRPYLTPGVSLVATDISQAMLDYARTKLHKLEGIDWQQADIADLPFSDASFDAVACQFGLMFVQDKHAAFQEIRRVMVKGGLLAFNVWDRIEDNPQNLIAHETIGQFFPENPPKFFEVPHGFHDVDLLRTLLSANGFDQIQIEAVPLAVYSDTAKSLATGLVEGAPVIAEIQERGGSSEPIVEAVAAALAQAGGEAPFRATMQAIVVTARAVGV